MQTVLYALKYWSNHQCKLYSSNASGSSYYGQLQDISKNLVVTESNKFGFPERGQQQPPSHSKTCNNARPPPGSSTPSCPALGSLNQSVDHEKGGGEGKRKRERRKQHVEGQLLQLLMLIQIAFLSPPRNIHTASPPSSHTPQKANQPSRSFSISIRQDKQSHTDKSWENEREPQFLPIRISLQSWFLSHNANDF